MGFPGDSAAGLRRDNRVLSESHLSMDGHGDSEPDCAADLRCDMQTHLRRDSPRDFRCDFDSVLRVKAEGRAAQAEEWLSESARSSCSGSCFGVRQQGCRFLGRRAGKGGSCAPAIQGLSPAGRQR